MKIAFTADLHLKSKVQSIERYNALFSMVEKVRQMKITNIIICGDLFDQDYPSYSDFDNFCKSNNDLNFFVIPGNHDSILNDKYFTSSNIKVINQSEIVNFDDSSFLFIPYNFNKSIDEEVSRFLTVCEKEEERSFENYVLIGHGDYITSSFNININGYEDGLYMPLTPNTINKYNFKKVILGHIHKPSNFGKVYYPGSPFPINTTETGKRSFIVYDTSNDNIDRIFIDTDFIYLNIEILSFPGEDEFSLIKKQIDKYIFNYNLKENELKKVILLLKIKGFTKDIKNLVKLIVGYLKELGLRIYEKDSLNKDSSNKSELSKDDTYKNWINIDELKNINEIDSVKMVLFENFKQKLETLDLQNLLINGNSVSCLKEDIMMDGMNIIFD